MSWKTSVVCTYSLDIKQSTSWCLVSANEIDYIEDTEKNLDTLLKHHQQDPNQQRTSVLVKKIDCKSTAEPYEQTLDGRNLNGHIVLQNILSTTIRYIMKV